jgi:cysteine desulfurase
VSPERPLTRVKAPKVVRAKRGWRVTTIAVDASGIVSPDRLRDAITDDTALVSVMHANNEIGTIQPIAELAAIAHERGALFQGSSARSVQEHEGRRRVRLRPVASPR